MTVNSFYANGKWNTKSELPPSGSKVTAESQGIVLLNGAQYPGFSRTYEVVQNPQTSGESPLLSVSPTFVAPPQTEPEQREAKLPVISEAEAGDTSSALPDSGSDSNPTTTE